MVARAKCSRKASEFIAKMSTNMNNRKSRNMSQFWLAAMLQNSV
jgi:hypothetical protein